MRNIKEQQNECLATLYLNFIDFEKAFDSAHRESLWVVVLVVASGNKSRGASWGS